MRRRTAVRIAAVLWACVTAAVSAPVASAQDRHVAFVRVLDLAGQPVTDLTADDFVVSEDGGRARVVSATAGTEPMRVALLIDNGESVRGSRHRTPGGRYASVVVATAMADAMTELATDTGIRYRDLSSRYRVVYERPDPPGSSVTVGSDRANIGLTRLFPDRRIDP